jgi:hypothetical protein
MQMDNIIKRKRKEKRIKKLIIETIIKIINIV